MPRDRTALDRAIAIEAAIAEIFDEHATPAAAAILELTERGFSREELFQQLKALTIDDYISVFRTVSACRDDDA